MKRAPLFSEHAIALNRALVNIAAEVPLALPAGYRLMNPFASGEALTISVDFYRAFYNDRHPRRLIFGINPGRHGAGLTGVPFTDSKKLAHLGIDARGIKSFEPSSVFIYEVIAAFGGAESFFREFYINSPLPLGLLRRNEKDHWVNANYYDTRPLTASVTPLIDYAMARYLAMPIDREVCYCLGQGKNYQFLQRWNRERRIFRAIHPLPHPRYVMQYRFAEKERYRRDYIATFNAQCGG